MMRYQVQIYPTSHVETKRLHNAARLLLLRKNGIAARCTYAYIH